MLDLHSFTNKNLKVRLYSDNSLIFQGGGEKTLVDLANYLTDIGLEVLISDNSNSNDLARIDFNELEKTIKCKYLPAIYIRSGVLRFLYHPMPDPKDLSAYDVNLISIHRIPSKSYLKKILPINGVIILACHGIGVERKLSLNFTVNLYQLYMRFAIIRIYRLVNHSRNIKLVVLTNGTKDIFTKFGIKDSKVIAIPNSVSKVGYEIGRNDRSFKILFIGRLNDNQKGIRRLKKVAERIIKFGPEIEVTILGSGPDFHILEKLKCKKIRVLGYISTIEKLNELKDSNLLIITSNMEPFSLVCLEALYSGLPVVSSPTNGPSEILQRISDSGTISSFSPTDITNTIIKYYNQWNENKEEYYQRKLKRSQFAKEIYSLNHFYDYYLESFKQLYDSMVNLRLISDDAI